MEPSTASASTHQDEPLDLTVGNNGSQEMSDDQKQHLYIMAALSNPHLLQIMLQTFFGVQMMQPFNIPEEPPENDSKENLITPKKELIIDENESTPSPRRTSTGKVDRRMIGKACTRRVEANARERNRVQTLSKTFEELKDCLPIDEDIKVSKLAILKVAAEYIGFLGAILNEDSDEEDKYRNRLQREMESAKALRR